MFHNFECFNQSCEGECGSGKMRTQFEAILAVIGEKSIEYYEHAEVTYVKSDLKKVNEFGDL